MNKIFLCEHIHPLAYERLRDSAEIISDWSHISEADGIINRNLNIDAACMDACPNLKVIGIHGTGTDGVDLVAAKDRGIKVVYVPYENAESVAELIVAFILVLSRQLMRIDRMLHRGEYILNGGGCISGIEIGHKTFGMIGCGDIAMRAGRRLKAAFGMHLIGYSPSLTKERAEMLGIEYCGSIEEVFEKADYVNIGVRLTEQTKNLITKKEMSHAKKGSMLINTARGGVVNEVDLYEMLKKGVLAGAACDVFEKEPPTSEHPLMQLDNFIGTPHIGANTDEALYRVGDSLVRQMIDILEGREEEKIRWVVE